jgi:lipid-A-disaccharide synthase
LKRRLGDGVRFVGVGGADGAEGVESPFDISELSIFGLLEGLLAYPPRGAPRRRDRGAGRPREARRGGADRLAGVSPCAWPIGCAEHDPKLPLVKYVAPQVWATAGAGADLAQAVDHLLSIHAFDAPPSSARA